MIDLKQTTTITKGSEEMVQYIPTMEMDPQKSMATMVKELVLEIVEKKEILNKIVEIDKSR